MSEEKLKENLNIEQMEISKKVIGLILLSLTDMDANEFKKKASELAKEIINKMYESK